MGKIFVNNFGFDPLHILAGFTFNSETYIHTSAYNLKEQSEKYKCEGSIACLSFQPTAWEQNIFLWGSMNLHSALHCRNKWKHKPSQYIILIIWIAFLFCSSSVGLVVLTLGSVHMIL